MSLVLDPSVVVRGDVVPPRLEFVAHRPHEVALDLLIESVEDALTQLHHIIVTEVGRVNGARAVLDGGLITFQTTGAEGAEFSRGAVEVDTMLGHVACGALDSLALVSRVGVGIVEASEP